MPIPSSGLKVPLRMVGARVSDLSYAAELEKKYASKSSDKMTFKQALLYYKALFIASWPVFLIVCFTKKAMPIVLSISLIVVALNCLFWVWIWQLSPDELDKFTACLDAGVVPSYRERLAYHIACFGGSL